MNLQELDLQTILQIINTAVLPLLWRAGRWIHSLELRLAIIEATLRENTKH